MVLQAYTLLINADGIMQTEWISHNVGHKRNWYTGVHKYAWKWFVIWNVIKVSEWPLEKIRQLKISKGTSKLEHLSMQENCWRVRNRSFDFVREMFTIINDIYISVLDAIRTLGTSNRAIYCNLQNTCCSLLIDLDTLIIISPKIDAPYLWIRPLGLVLSNLTCRLQ